MSSEAPNASFVVEFPAAVLFVLVGMGWGIQGGYNAGPLFFTAHAHLNLLGWVSLFLFGVSII
jgi:hypothetical protein